MQMQDFFDKVAEMKAALESSLAEIDTTYISLIQTAAHQASAASSAYQQAKATIEGSGLNISPDQIQGVTALRQAAGQAQANYDAVVTAYQNAVNSATGGISKEYNSFKSKLIALESEAAQWVRNEQVRTLHELPEQLRQLRMVSGGLSNEAGLAAEARLRRFIGYAVSAANPLRIQENPLMILEKQRN